MAEPQTGLHVAISGDCEGLIKATDRAESRLEGFAGNSYRASVGVSGVPQAVSELGKVGDAAGRVPSSIPIGVDAGQVAEARGQLTGLGSDARQAGRDLDSAFGGSRALSFSGGGEIRQLTGDLGRAQESYQSLGQTAEGVMQRADQETKAFTQSQRAMNAEMQVGGRSTAVLSTGLDNVGESAQAGSRTMNAFEQDMASASSQMDKSTQGVTNHTAALRQLQRAQADVGGGGGLPPIDAGGGGGGGGRGGVPRVGGGGGGKGENLSDFDIGGAAMPGMLLGVGGVIGEMVGGAAGLMSVNMAIKDTPDLAYAAGNAMSQFGKGVRQTASAAIGEGVPALHQLGAALGPLGREVGSIGAQNMGSVLSGVTELARSATGALHNLEPAIGPAVSGLLSLADGVVQGLGNPAVAASAKGLADSINKSGAADAVRDITSGIVTAGDIALKTAVDVTSALVKPLGGSAGLQDLASQIDLPTAVAGGGAAGWAAKAMGASPKTAGIAGFLGAASFAIASAEQQRGIDSTPGQVGGLIGGGLGGLVGGPVGAGIGFGVGEATGLATTEQAPTNTAWGRDLNAGGAALNFVGDIASDVVQAPGVFSRNAHNGNLMGGLRAAGKSFGNLTAAGNDVDQRFSDELTGTASGQNSAQSLATSQAAAPFGYDKAQDGTLTPSTGPGGGGGTYPGGPKPSPNDPSTSTRAPAPGSSGTTLSPQQVQQLSGALPGLSSNLSATGSAAQQLSSGLQTAPQSAQQMSQGLQQVSQASQQMAAPMQQVQQHMANTTQAVQQMAQQTPQALAQTAQIAPAVNKSLGEASAQIASSGQSMGAQIPASMGSGIDQNQQAACDAANKMGKNAANCGAAALQTASPSKIFVTIGASIPQGLALGIENETPAALSAISSSMGKVVQAGQAGLQTASPSKAFASVGQQAMQQATAGAQNYAPGSNPRYPQLNNIQKDAEQAQKDLQEANDPIAKSDQAYSKFLDKMGYDKDTRDRLLQKHQDQEKKDSNSPESIRQKLNQGALNRTMDNQRDAMRRAGIKDIADDPSKAGGLSPMGQYHKNQLDRALADHQLGLDAVMAGKSPQGVLDDRQNASLGAGPDVGADKGGAAGVGAPGDGGKGAPPAKGKGKGGSPMGVWGDPANGNNKVGQGSNSNNYAPDSGKMSGDGSDAGKAMNQGMADGIAGSAGLPSSQARKSAAQILQQTQSTLGIHSPSREFHNIGDMSMRGWVEGIQQGRGGLDREWERLDRDQHDWMDKWGKFPFPTANSGGGGGGGGGGGSGGAGGGGGGGVGVAPIIMNTGHLGKEFADRFHQVDIPGLPGGRTTDIPADVRRRFLRAQANQERADLSPLYEQLVGGMGSGVQAASNGVMPIANSSGLQVGMEWGRSVTTGLDSVLTAANFSQISLPQIGSALSKTALGQLGLLGPAGAGASVSSNPAVTVASGAASSTPVVNNHIYIDGKQFKDFTTQQINTTLNQLADQVSAQRG